MVSTVTGAQLADLPLPQRGTLAIERLAPGAVDTSPNSQYTNIPIGNQQPQISANGRPASSNLYRMDGLPIMSSANYGNINLTPTPDMVAEAALQTNTFNAEVGGTSSIVTDFTTKSGTNVLHGDIEGTYSSRYFASHQWNAATAPYTQKWLSGSLGGPIVKNHTFFFGSAQTQVLQNSPTSTVGSEETDQFYNWAQQALPNSSFVNKFMAFRPSRIVPTKITKYASDVFPANGTIPCGGVYQGIALMSCSTPLFETGYFPQSPTLNGTQYNVRLDHYFHEDRDRIFLNYYRVDQTSQFLSPRPSFDGLTPSSTQFWALNYVHTFTPTLLNEAQFGWTRYNSFFTGRGGPDYWALVPLVMLDLGFDGTDTLGFQGYFPSDISPGGSNTKEHQYVFRDYATWVKARHSLRFGLDAAHRDYWLDQAGFYARPFTPLYSGLWNLLNDNAFQYSLFTLSAQTGKFIAQTFGSQVTQLGLYVQDEWKIKPNLTLNWGLRWDDYGNPYNYGDRSQPYVNVFYTGSGANRAALQSSLVNTAYTKFVQHPFNGRLNKNFEPRLGLAWALGKDRKTVLRAGFGYYIDALDIGTVTATLPTQPPNRLTITTNANNPNAIQPGKTPYGTVPSFPYNFNYPTVVPGGFNSRGAPLTSSGQILLSNIAGIDPNLTPQKTGIWNFGIQHELPGRIVGQLSYAGSYSWDQFYRPNFNLAPNQPSLLTNQWGAINYFTNGFTANYNAFIVSAQQRLGGLTWTASYTWSHTLTDQFLPSSSNLAAITYGNANFDVRQHFSFGGTYQLPSPRRAWLKEIAGGWSIGAIFLAQSGTPFTVTLNNNNLNDGAGCGSNGCLVPDVTQPLQTSGFSRAQYEAGILPTQTVDGKVVAVGFAKPATGVVGNEGVNIFRNPGYLNLDSSLVKRIVLPWVHDQTSALTFRAESLNTLNRVNLLGIGSTVWQPGTAVTYYGQSVNAALPRIWQLGLRFEF